MAGKSKWADLVKKDQKNPMEKTGGKDDRYWKPTTDKEGEAVAIIRFLPSPSGEVFVKYLDHSFDYTVGTEKKRYWKKCINTFGYDKECPICAQSWELKNSAFEKDQKIAGQRCRKINFVSNIYVIRDPNNPEAEGKVFLFRYGQKIFDKIREKQFPTDKETIDPEFKQFIPGDLFEGANFKLVVKKQGEFPNGQPMPEYSASVFSAQSVFMDGDDDKLDEIMEKVHELDEFVKESDYPSNEEVWRILAPILGKAPDTFDEGKDEMPSNPFGDEEDEPSTPAPNKALFDDDDEPPFVPTPEPVKEEKKEKAPKKEKEKPAEEAPAPKPAPVDEEDDDTFFADFKKK